MALKQRSFKKKPSSRGEEETGDRVLGRRRSKATQPKASFPPFGKAVPVLAPLPFDRQNDASTLLASWRALGSVTAAHQRPPVTDTDECGRPRSEARRAKARSFPPRRSFLCHAWLDCGSALIAIDSSTHTHIHTPTATGPDSASASSCGGSRRTSLQQVSKQDATANRQQDKQAALWSRSRADWSAPCCGLVKVDALIQPALLFDWRGAEAAAVADGGWLLAASAS